MDPSDDDSFSRTLMESIDPFNRSIDSIRTLKSGRRSVISSASLSTICNKSEIAFSNLAKKKKKVTFNAKDHIKTIPNRFEIEQDQENWSPNGTNRKKNSVFNSTSFLHLAEQHSSMYFDLKKHFSIKLKPFSYKPIFNQQKIRDFGNSNRLFLSRNHRSSTNITPDLSTTPRRPPLRQKSSKAYDMRFPRKFCHYYKSEKSFTVFHGLCLI
uniref:Uncharacterized protein n=1 Tax=Panagrolaimus sp. PS1159 TaxID=55785 RepID=A0AC35EU32_9BILA